ncbi:hypothetical protein GCM10010430_66790 [Kitasatospora cystarginea]|uniref:Uncharacterized protein n=1 Tax=Kitasatospora cystarginea TaxID=58350 RepID=A0ABN3EUV3_9ACTN
MPKWVPKVLITSARTPADRSAQPYANAATATDSPPPFKIKWQKPSAGQDHLAQDRVSEDTALLSYSYGQRTSSSE